MNNIQENLTDQCLWCPHRDLPGRQEQDPWFLHAKTSSSCPRSWNRVEALPKRLRIHHLHRKGLDWCVFFAEKQWGKQRCLLAPWCIYSSHLHLKGAFSISFRSIATTEHARILDPLCAEYSDIFIIILFSCRSRQHDSVKVLRALYCKTADTND